MIALSIRPAPVHPSVIRDDPWMLVFYLPNEEVEALQAEGIEVAEPRTALLPVRSIYNYFGEPKLSWFSDRKLTVFATEIRNDGWRPEKADLLTLRFLIERHDFSYSYSDDARVNNAGEANRTRIVTLVKSHPEWLTDAITFWNGAARQAFKDDLFCITPDNVKYVFGMSWPEGLEA